MPSADASLPVAGAGAPAATVGTRRRWSSGAVGLLVTLVADANVFLALAFGVVWLAHVPAGLAPGRWIPLRPVGTWSATTAALVVSAVMAWIGARHERARLRLLLAGLAAAFATVCAVRAFGEARLLRAPVVSLHALTLALFALHAWVAAVPRRRLGGWRRGYALYLAGVWVLLAVAAAFATSYVPGAR